MREKLGPIQIRTLVTVEETGAEECWDVYADLSPEIEIRKVEVNGAERPLDSLDARTLDSLHDDILSVLRRDER